MTIKITSVPSVDLLVEKDAILAYVNYQNSEKDYSQGGDIYLDDEHYTRVMEMASQIYLEGEMRFLEAIKQVLIENEWSDFLIIA